VALSTYEPFAAAISDKLLFKAWYDKLSLLQQVTLRAYYGLPLETADQRAGWAILNDACVYDELGYPTEVFDFPYEPNGEFEQLWAIIGRRGGKTTLIGALIFAYEVLLGGHLDDDQVIKGQEPRAVLISQMKDVAVENLVSIKLCLESSKVGTLGVAQVNTDAILMKNGISIVASSPNIKAQRGLAIPVVGMDEVGFWYKDAESANPDYEVVRAVSAAQGTFRRRKRFAISTPWSKEGLLFEHHIAGTEGRRLAAGLNKKKYQGTLVVEATTAAMTLGMARPHIDRGFLEVERAKDPDGFDREYLKKFVDSVSQFIKRELVEKCVQEGVAENAPNLPSNPDYDSAKQTPIYVAVMDPAFRRDAYGFGIVHHERGRGIVVDKLMRFLPKPARDKGKAIKLDPKAVMEDILPFLRAYGITHIFSDQYQLETLQQLWLEKGIAVEGFDFTTRSKTQICSNLESLINQQRIWMLDPKTGPVQQQAFEEVIALEKILRPNGSVAISAPANGFDDMAMTIALAAFKALWVLAPDGPQQQELPEEHQPKTVFQKVDRMLVDRKDRTDENDVWD
jgi:hypothetical protein